MKAGKYSIRELFSNRYIEQIVVPEIQRDYVWGKEQVTGLLTSIVNDFTAFGKGNIELSTTINPDIADAFREYYKRQMFSSNIGFIYAYNDPEYGGKYFLIDGQQRITSIYILLLALASKVDSFKPDFSKIYLDNGKLKLDYKVREASHDFLKQFVDFALNGIGKVTDQSWYYKEYESDATISSIVGNYSIISDFLDQTDIQLIDFANYLQDFVDFWYFDTNISEQGEELYIYMNARGEQMQGNENLKADILSRLSNFEVEKTSSRADNTYSKDLDGAKKYWGLKWEAWQDFFWKNRRSNSNADDGFNNFLLCVAGLENFLSSIEVFYSKEEFERNIKGRASEISYFDLQNALSRNKIRRIEKYINALLYLEQNVAQFTEGYDPECCRWCRRCLDEIWSILNTGKTNWFADYADQNRGTEVSRMVFIWSALYYLSSDQFESKAVSVSEAFRTLRILFVRFKNFNRAIMNIAGNMDAILEEGSFYASSIYVEENHKHNLYQNCGDDLLKKYEEIIWVIEDHPYNLDGRNLRNANIGHLVNFNDDVTVNQLIKIKDLFYSLFPVSDNSVKKGKTKILQSLLLFYGKYWFQDTPYYYHNYCLGEWPRIIRDMDSEGNVFSAFFKEILSSEELDLSAMFERKSAEISINFSTTDLREQLLWYAMQLKEHLWKQGDYIAVRTDWEGYDKVFSNSKRILNTKGDFKGGNPTELATLVPETTI